uniref:Lipocalin-like domain-containing protein n=1 Tax=Calcidiscus leptoporus TaxID=127549 RepID=A0A7S0J060_9EUKA|mmetsp:Transcript_3094/g.7000  ORF Transcript_3094/g.7000 Transcript_3094/m.7000 type:complete len:173 (+) Transcript_3094:109-627(+)
MDASSLAGSSAVATDSSAGKRPIAAASPAATTTYNTGGGHVAGLWLGEATPAPELAHSVPVNPITWSLALLPSQAGQAPNAFGGGYFDDAGDIPGSPVLLFTLDGKYDAATGTVQLTKRYVSHNIPEILVVQYAGTLSREADGAHAIKGTWTNVLEETRGVFGCRLEPGGGA